MYVYPVRSDQKRKIHTNFINETNPTKWEVSKTDPSPEDAKKRLPSPRLQNFLGFWHRISESAKVANGFMKKMCLLWRNRYEGKYVEGYLVHAQNEENWPPDRWYGSTSQSIFRLAHWVLRRKIYASLYRVPSAHRTGDKSRVVLCERFDVPAKCEWCLMFLKRVAAKFSLLGRVLVFVAATEKIK